MANDEGKTKQPAVPPEVDMEDLMHVLNGGTSGEAEAKTEAEADSAKPKADSAKPKPKAAKPKPKAKPKGRPRGSRSKNSKVAEAAFVQAYLEHDGNAMAAYQSLHPDCKSKNAARVEGHKWLKRPGVKQELEARKEEARALATKAAAYDLMRAHEEICERIDAASEAGQHTAVASLMREKLKLWKLVDSKEATAQAGFSIVIHQADGETKVVGTTEEG